MEIDRVSPTHRPQERRSMFHRWSELLFLHWEVPAASLEPLLPPGLTLDTYEGKAYIGLVPFTMSGIRPVWFPAVPWLSNFHETNVRTYVHLEGRDPGVWFFSLDAANPVAVWLARTFWALPYYSAAMSLLEDRTTGRIEYQSQRRSVKEPGEIKVSYTPQGQPKAAEVGSLEHFLAERYILYAYRKQTLFSGRVYHTPYPLERAEIHSLEESLLAASRISRPLGLPPLAQFARSVSVEVFPLRRALRLSTPV